MPYTPKSCITCNSTFIPRGSAQKYCPTCGLIRRRQRNDKTTKRYRAQGGDYDLCPDCGQRKQRHHVRCRACHYRNLAEHPELTPMWQGGRQKTSGYIKIRIGPNQAKWEHRLVWEQFHSKSLPEGWLVHHLNGVKDDNRPENLAALPRKSHGTGTYIKHLQKRIRDLEQLHLPL